MPEHPPFTGEVVCLAAYDVAHELRREPVQSLLGHQLTTVRVDRSRPGPARIIDYSPQALRLPPQRRRGPRGEVDVRWSITMLPVGALSVTVRVPFTAGSLDELLAYHDLTLDGRPLTAEITDLVERARAELRPVSIRPHERLGEPEVYTVFCLATSARRGDPMHLATGPWLEANRRVVAALLTGERDADHLSAQEVGETTQHALSYYDHDLVVIDWDAALLLDEPTRFDETLSLMELANIQLVELGAYDRALDATIERSYRGLAERRGAHAKELAALRETRLDLARLSDELENLAKFVGDWHQARVYQALSARFHLPEWNRVVDQKLQTLDSMYQLVRQEQGNRVMLVLEATIVLLFIIDLVILGLLSKP